MMRRLLLRAYLRRKSILEIAPVLGRESPLSNPMRGHFRHSHFFSLNSVYEAHKRARSEAHTPSPRGKQMHPNEIHEALLVETDERF